MSTHRLHSSALLLVVLVVAVRVTTEAKLVPNFYSKTFPRAEQIVAAGGGRGVAEAALAADHRRGCAPRLLPRLLRQRVRRVGAGVPQRVRAVRARRHAEPVAPGGRLRGRDARQDGARARVPGRRLLRRRARPRGAGPRHHDGGSLLPAPPGGQGRARVVPPAPDDELPLANSSVPRLIAMFAAKGFTDQDPVALSGAHTLGFAHCSEFADRIFRRTKGGGAAPHDPTMNPAYAKGLQDACKNYMRDPTVAVFNDIMTPGKFDNMYFVNLQRGLGLLATDQELWTDPRTRPLVQHYAANQTAFFADFARAIVKLSVQGVKTGRDGEVRRRCDMFNGNPVPRG